MHQPGSKPRIWLADEVVGLSRSVLLTLQAVQEAKPATEIGGQLFGFHIGDRVVVSHATITWRGAQRGPTHFRPHPEEEQREIDHLAEVGLGYLGDWHSHPEPEPYPSSTDKQSIQETFRQSLHRLDSMLLVIVGNRVAANGIFVAVADERGILPVRWEQESDLL